MAFLQTILAFVIALGVLVVIHELGHFLVARQCGVKVLRFSVGFGRTLWARRFGRDQTEWALCAIPLGGYVKMLDEREGEVAPEERHRAFNVQSVGKRFAIVLAGPVANLLLAIAVYCLLYISGEQQIRPLMDAPVAGSAAAAAGFQAGEEVLSVDGLPVRAWSEVRWRIIQSAFDERPLKIEAGRDGAVVTHHLDARKLEFDEGAQDILLQLGFQMFDPPLAAIVGVVQPRSVGAAAGFQEGDKILAINQQTISSWQAAVKIIRSAADKRLEFVIERAGRQQILTATPASVKNSKTGEVTGRLGLGPKPDPELAKQYLVTLRYPVTEAFVMALRQTWETAVFSLKMFGKMITGAISWQNLSGPLTIADYAGQSAKMGIDAYLKFIALISISLAVLNLLPIPLLDGGHLLYYSCEIIRGRPLPESVMEMGQKIGLALLAMLMALALFNDISRQIAG